MSDIIVKTESANLRKKSATVFDYSFIGSLLITILAFGISDSSFENNTVIKVEEDIIEVVNIPPTEQLTKPPPPSKPQIPVEAEDEDEIDEVTIDDTDVDIMEEYSDIEEPEEEDEPLEYFAVAIKPTIKVKVKPVYPDIARKIGLEKRVTVQVTIDKNGIPTNAKVIKGHPMLDEAAIKAALAHRFTPAMQGDKPVPVKWNIPFNFRLRN